MDNWHPQGKVAWTHMKPTNFVDATILGKFNNTFTFYYYYKLLIRMNIKICDQQAKGLKHTLEICTGEIQIFHGRILWWL